MKNVFVIPLILIILVKPLWPLVEYIVNYDYITTNLCENQDRPELQCNGKCYLAKMLAEENSQQQDNPFESNHILFEWTPLLFHREKQLLKLVFPVLKNGKRTTYYLSKKIGTLYLDILSPPPKNLA